MRHRRGRRRELGGGADINVTSLVDVAFTLLVIFIITAPMMHGGVEVSVPRAETQTLVAPEGLMVTVDRDGSIFLGDSEAETPWERFPADFTSAVRERGAESVYLRADEGVPYGRVVRVLGAMKAAEVARVGLVAEPDRGEP